MPTDEVQELERMLSKRRDEESPRAKFAVGAEIDGWKVLAFLGRGLSAEVYRVTNVRFGHEGALKLLVDGTRGLKERFLTESDAIKFLSLRALPRFMGAGDYEGAPYYVMEYLQPLPDPMPRREIPFFMNKVAKAVQSLHASGYIHRDLKPGNILRRANGEPVLIDLGLIKKRGASVTDPIVRHGQDISIVDGKPVGVGTPGFAAHEQLLKGEATVQSDIFSLGKILDALYEGRPPHNGKRIVHKATREQPGDRYESADEFAAALRHRNYGRYFRLTLLALGLLGAALFPRMRPYLARIVKAWLAPPPVMVVQQSGETERAFFRRIKTAAEGGNTAAQVALAEAYYYGRGSETNREEAVRWYRIAAEAGDAGAQASLGMCLFNGIGCVRDRKEAIRCFTLAADKRDLAAMADLAYCRLHGLGCEQDLEAGFRLAQSAAELGHPRAQAIVGECYLEGVVGTQDVVRAELWLSRAARNGDKRAAKLLRRER